VNSGERRVDRPEFKAHHSPLSTVLKSRSSACRNPGRSRPAWW
jgi:hypothetical protein